MKAIAVLALAASIAGCGADTSGTQADVAGACSDLGASLRALPPYENSPRQALTLRKLTEAFARAKDKLAEGADPDVDAFATALGRINLLGAQLMQGERQATPGSGAALNQMARRETERLDAAARKVGVAACQPLAELTRERLKVPEV